MFFTGQEETLLEKLSIIMNDQGMQENNNNVSYSVQSNKKKKKVLYVHTVHTTNTYMMCIYITIAAAAACKKN